LNLDKFIYDLLFLHDCVIIPDFGGFVANYAPASLHPTKHSLMPPSKKIAFNKKLTNNDGLLANHIALKERISYSEALKIVEGQVAIFQILLKEGKTLSLQPTGTLFLDSENNIQFEPGADVNFLLDSYGLIMVQSPAIKRDSVLQRIDKQFQDRPPLEPAARQRRFPWKVFVPVPFLALAIWGSTHTEMLNAGFRSSSLNPFYSQSIPNTNIQQEAGKKVIPAIDSSSKSGQTVEAISTAVAPVEKAPLSSAYSYFIIAGCFKEEHNAENMLVDLKSKGFDAFIKGKNANGLTMVCYQGFQSREEASLALNKIHIENDQNAWICNN
jgi:cell division septation protein DedD